MKFCLIQVICILLCCLILPHFLESKSTVHKSIQLNSTKCVTPDTFKRKPVVIIPGILGSRLEAKVNRTVAPFPCKKQSDWEELWLNLEYLLPFYVNCWVADLKMEYDNVTRKLKNGPGVDVRAPFFGGTTGFEYLDQDTFAPGSKYFAPLIDYLVCNFGYTRKKDLRGAPFDWRLAPYQQKEYFENLTALVEDTYRTNNNQKVALIGHSLGCLFTYYFLQSQTEQWKETYIDLYVSISGPYIGAVKSLKAILSGDAEGHPRFVPRLKVREIVRTGSAFMFLIPRPDMWPKGKDLVVVTLQQNYTVNDYQALFDRIGCKWCWEIWKDNEMTLGSLDPPSVPVHCIYGSQTPTTEALVYDEDLFPDDAPSLIDGSGDGTVNVWSSSFCLRWEGQQKAPVSGFEMPGNDHVRILWNATLHNYLGKVLVT